MCSKLIIVSLILTVTLVKLIDIPSLPLTSLSEGSRKTPYSTSSYYKGFTYTLACNLVNFMVAISMLVGRMYHNLIPNSVTFLGKMSKKIRMILIESPKLIA